MNRSSLIIAGAVAVVLVTALLLFRNEEPASAQAPVAIHPTTDASTAGFVPSPTDIPAAANSPPAAAAPRAEAGGEYPDLEFKANRTGRMLTDERARLNLENLLAQYTPAERQQKLQQLQTALPPAAARDLADMLERYLNYDAAQRQTFPPGSEPSSPQEGLNILDSMHNLRVQYFGTDAADAMFGKEERIQRELLRLMSLEEDPSLTIEEKAERAQALYRNQMPETAAQIATGGKQVEQIEAAGQQRLQPEAN